MERRPDMYVLKGEKRLKLDNPKAVKAEIQELYKVQKGLPKGELRSRIDKEMHKLRCKLDQLLKSKTI